MSDIESLPADDQAIYATVQRLALNREITRVPIADVASALGYSEPDLVDRLTSELLDDWLEYSAGELDEPGWLAVATNVDDE